jgi:RsiW-degrading membrane proteinase PrsW (M82 family)
MAEPKEKNRAKYIVLWIITVALVALAIFWYQKPK